MIGADIISIAHFLRRKDVCSERSGMASTPTSINNLPDELLLEILSHCGPENILHIAKVCKHWNALTKEVVLWKRLSYICDNSSNISPIKEVRCTALLRFRAK
jgi:hypothetical protein